MIRIENLTKKFGKVEAVSSLNLHIPKGELFGFLGPNGAGKTTTIKILSGLLKPTSGFVTIGGFNVQEAPRQAKKLVGLIPDQPFVYGKLTGEEFLNFVANLYEIPSSKINKKRKELLAIFELTDWRNELIESYSHGMRQKLVICAALIHDPKVIIVDEPMVGLDPKSAQIVKHIFKNLSKKGITIFMSTHTLEVAEQLCDRIGIIQKGKLIALGNKEDLRRTARIKDIKLENIFLELTGDAEMQKVIEFLKKRF